MTESFDAPFLTFPRQRGREGVGARVRRLLFFVATVLSGLWQPQTFAADAIAELQRFYGGLDDLQTRFEQTQYDETGAELQASRGDFLLSRPNRFRWDYREPYAQMMLSDGLTFWFYDVDLAQVTRRSAANALQGTPALLLAGGPALTREFTLTALNPRDGLSWVLLVPKSKESDFREIRLGLAKGVPSRMELHDNLGQLTRIRFFETRVNPGVAPGRFAFEIPAGVEVVDGDAVAPGAR